MAEVIEIWSWLVLFNHTVPGVVLSIYLSICSNTSNKTRLTKASAHVEDVKNSPLVMSGQLQNPSKLPSYLLCHSLLSP